MTKALDKIPTGWIRRFITNVITGADLQRILAQDLELVTCSNPYCTHANIVDPHTNWRAQHCANPVCRFPLLRAESVRVEPQWECVVNKLASGTDQSTEMDRS